MGVLDDWWINANWQSSDGQNMTEKIIHKHEVLHWLRELGSDRLSGGSFREVVTTNIGKEVSHDCSFASAMSWTHQKSVYESRLGKVPSWMSIVTPLHRVKLCRFALERLVALPQMTESAVLAAYQSGRKSSNAVRMRPPASEIHAGKGLDEHIWHFDVSDSGALTVAGFKSPNTRSEIYESVADSWAESPAHLADALEEIRPLAWAVNEIYLEVRSELESDRDAASNDAIASDERVQALTERLDAMPEEPDDGARVWLLALTTEEFERLVMPDIEKWFSEEPDWNYEYDYIRRTATSQGAALEFFESKDGHESDALGVELIYGEHPGSTYYAAELRADVDAANKVAIKAGIPVRFKRLT